MELRTLRYFLAAAQEENITRAADILHVTQPTLSRQIMDLERELGSTLMIRGKNGLTLTDDGIFFRQRRYCHRRFRSGGKQTVRKTDQAIFG